MIEREWDELIQDELDDANTPERSARLRAWLAAHPEGRERMRELEGLFGTLAHVEREPAPPDLKPGVLAAIAAEESAVGARRGGWLESLSALWERRPALRWAYGLAAVAMVAVAGYALMARGPAVGRQELPVSGSMAPVAWAPVDEVRLEEEGLAHTLRTERSGDQVRLRLDGATGAGAVMVVRFEPASLASAGVSWPAAAGRVDLAPGRVTLAWAGPAPVARFRVLRAGPAPLRIELRLGGVNAGTVLRTSEAPVR